MEFYNLTFSPKLRDVPKQNATIRREGWLEYVFLGFAIDKEKCIRIADFDR